MTDWHIYHDCRICEIVFFRSDPFITPYRKKILDFNSFFFRMDLSVDENLLDAIDDLEYKFDEEYLDDEGLQFGQTDEVNPQSLLSGTNEDDGDIDNNDFSDSFYDDEGMEDLLDFDDDKDHGKLSQKDKVRK